MQKAKLQTKVSHLRFAEYTARCTSYSHSKDVLRDFQWPNKAVFWMNAILDVGSK